VATRDGQCLPSCRTSNSTASVTHSKSVVASTRWLTTMTIRSMSSTAITGYVPLAGPGWRMCRWPIHPLLLKMPCRWRTTSTVRCGTHLAMSAPGGR